jgi:hypothetical protein
MVIMEVQQLVIMYMLVLEEVVLAALVAIRLVLPEAVVVMGFHILLMDLILLMLVEAAVALNPTYQHQVVVGDREGEVMVVYWLDLTQDYLLVVLPIQVVVLAEMVEIKQQVVVVPVSSSLPTRLHKYL